ncbi:type I-D CRISPR-associated helicase Cas3' [Natronococcus wangiae]|uniref:type I-D CRISPR-associated helicase Cas3' n=1 Tax=Natronococcus wangiae TaxID=3068275 RepID=UPI00273E4538|nr:type I-D CRISPR-associated helicase Cas3' [Natronococcus sp. AD5]
MNETLSLSGVELRRHASADYPVADPAFKPYAHQRELLELFRTEESFLAVNDSPTGGGKTMSWLAPVVESGEHALAVYPTNALIHDQERNLRSEFAENFPDTRLGEDTKILTVTADSLRMEYAEEFPDADSNGDRLRRLLRREIYYREKQVILLTNPDIFVMMRRGLYGREGNPGSEVRALNEFGTIVVDEFHRAGRKEQNTLLFLLDEMYDIDDYRCGLSRIVLLSATPTDWLEQRFVDAMSPPYIRVTDQHEDTERRSFADSPTSGWGAVMPPVELDVRTSSTFGTVDELLGDDWEETREFAARDGKTVFILDGIREVDDVYSRLNAELDDQEVVRIDGFHRGDLESKLACFDVLVSNSAVEVGIDFTVDRLLFSAHNQASFLQRLGRLRTETESQSARCYVPSIVSVALEGLSETDTIPRTALIDTLTEAYRDPRDRKSFDWRYSAAEAAHHIRKRTWNANPELADRIRERGWERITDHFAPDEGLNRSDVERYVDIIDGPIENTLQWYRGDSLQVLVYDRTGDSHDPLRSYDLFYLLRHGDVRFYSRSTFEEIVLNEHQYAIRNSASFVVGFCTYDGTIPPNEDGYGRDVVLRATPEIYSWLDQEDRTNTRTPRVVNDLSVDVRVNDGSRRIDTIENLRDGMDELELLCYIVDQPPWEVANQYDLGPFFFLYGIQVRDELRSIAIGTDALFLHCAVKDEHEAGGLERFGVDI